MVRACSMVLTSKFPMRWITSIPLLILLVGQLSGADAPLPAKPAVFIELFTSEGCSSCPPADRMLEQFDRESSASQQLIVLSEHVDYWNRTGWKDPYSSSFYSQRQIAYANSFRIDGPYTPQMVVDGRAEFVGSDVKRAQHAVGVAQSVPKASLHITGLGFTGPDSLHAHLETGKISADGQVFVAVALDRAESQVSAGENSGKHLTHVAVAQVLSKVGTVEKGKSFSQDVDLKLDPKMDRSSLRVIAFVQEAGLGHVLAVSQEKLK